MQESKSTFFKDRNTSAGKHPYFYTSVSAFIYDFSKFMFGTFDEKETLRFSRNIHHSRYAFRVTKNTSV